MKECFFWPVIPERHGRSGHSGHYVTDTIYSSICSRKYAMLFSRILDFHWFPKVFLPTVFCLDVVQSHKWSHTVHPRRKACFPLVLQGLPCRVACSRWGGGSRGAVSIGYRVARKACFPKGLQGFRVNRVRIRVRFFWPTPKSFVLSTF